MSIWELLSGVGELGAFVGDMITSTPRSDETTATAACFDVCGMSPYARIDHEMPESTGASLRTIIEGGGGSVARVEGHAVMAWFDASDAAVETWLDLVDASRRGQCGAARGGVAWGPTGDASHSIDVARRAADLAELAGPGELYTTMELLDVISSDQARYTVESLGDEQPKLYRLRAVG